MMVQPGGSATNGATAGTVSPSIQRIPLPGTFYTDTSVHIDEFIFLRTNPACIIQHLLSLYRTRIIRGRTLVRKCKTVSSNLKATPSTSKIGGGR